MVGDLRGTPICRRGFAAQNQEIERAFGLKENLAELHLALLKKADMIEEIDGFYRLTTVGSAYIKNFDAFISP